jgi:hypothetical protein
MAGRDGLTLDYGAATPSPIEEFPLIVLPSLGKTMDSRQIQPLHRLHSECCPMMKSDTTP